MKKLNNGQVTNESVFKFTPPIRTSNEFVWVDPFYFRSPHKSTSYAIIIIKAHQFRIISIKLQPIKPEARGGGGQTVSSANDKDQLCCGTIYKVLVLQSTAN